MKEAAELMAVDRVVGGIKVQDDALGGLLMSVEEQIDEQLIDGAGLTGDLLVAAVLVGPDRSQFDAVEGTLAGQGLALVGLAATGLSGGIVLADDGGQQGI